MVRRLLAGLPLLLLVATANAKPAPAPQPTEAEVEAKKLFDDGNTSFRLGEYDAAIDAYKKGFRLVPRPIFLYNIAQAHRLAGRLKEAVTFYKSYVNAAPDADDRAEVDARIAELEATIQKQESAKTAPPVGPGNGENPRPKIPGPDKVAEGAQPRPTPTTVPDSDSPRSKPIYKKWWFWTGVGVVVAGAAAVTVIAMSGDGGGAPDSDLGNFPVF